MRLEKAIEIKQAVGDEFLALEPEDMDQAEELSISALGRILDMRQSPCTTADEALPGETTD